MIYAATIIDSWQDIIFYNLIHQIETYEATGSGWVWFLNLHLDVQTALIDPLSASSFIPLPDKLRMRNARSTPQFLLNIKNDDQKCFVYNIIAKTHPAPEGVNEEDVTFYKQFEHEVNMSGIKYPVNIMDIRKFETQNPQYSVLVLAFNEQNKIFPVKRHDNKEAKIFVDLLYITSKNSAHYVLVKNRTTLLQTQAFKQTGAMFTCDNCLCFFYYESALKKHQELCYLKDTHLASYPKEGEKLKFTKFENQV